MASRGVDVAKADSGAALREEFRGREGDAAAAAGEGEDLVGKRHGKLDVGEGIYANC